MAEPHPHLGTIRMNLPTDILFYNILPRLPAKSLLRFKCVSKEWHSSLTTPLFEKLHLQHVTNDHHHQNYHKLLACSKQLPLVFHTIDCEAPEDALAAGRPLPFNASPKNLRVLASFGGLVCVSITNVWCNKARDEEYSDLILWNPLTGDYKTLSNINSYRKRYKCHGSTALILYYSSCDDDYKLLSITCNCDTYIYSLKSDSWRKIDSCDNDLKRRRRCGIFERWWPSTTVNEKIYILKDISKELHSIIMFDTKTEKFTKIATPPLENQAIHCLDFLVLRGCIHIYVIYGDNRSSIVWDVEIWRLDDGDANWKKVVTYHMPNLKPLHLMRDGNWLTRCSFGRFVYKMDLARDIKIITVNTHGMDIHPRGKYIETLVSPNRYL